MGPNKLYQSVIPLKKNVTGIYVPERVKSLVKSNEKLSFDDWYKTIPKEKNDTSNYNLRRAYELAPQEQLDAFQNSDAHLMTAYENKLTGEYEFMKSRNHPTINMELDWYNSNDPKAIEFRNNYKLDTSREYYKYIPIK
jgi:hypothetical protein